MTLTIGKTKAMFAAVILSLLMSGVEHACSQEPPQADVLEKKANDLFVAKKWNEAAKAYAQLSKVTPDNSLVWFRLGYALHAAKKYSEAIKAHQKAAVYPKYRASSYYNLACAFALTGKKDEAFAALQKAVDAGFVNKAVMKTDPDLQSLRTDTRFGKIIASVDKSYQLYRQLDFWVGDWVVVNRDGKKVGKNKIQKLEKGHLLLEHWDNLKGGSGKSINFVDPMDKKWKQIWVDPTGNVVRYSGEFKDGMMVLRGASVKKDGSTELSQMTLKPLADGRVRQFIQHSKDNGKTWYVYFEGYYVRAGKPGLSKLSK